MLPPHRAQEAASWQLQNLLSDCAAFGLRPLEAEQILNEVQATVQAGWKTALQNEGLGHQHLHEWARCFAPLADHLT